MQPKTNEPDLLPQRNFPKSIRPLRPQQQKPQKLQKPDIQQQQQQKISPEPYVQQKHRISPEPYAQQQIKRTPPPAYIQIQHKQPEVEKQHVKWNSQDIVVDELDLSARRHPKRTPPPHRKKKDIHQLKEQVLSVVVQSHTEPTPPQYRKSAPRVIHHSISTNPSGSNPSILSYRSGSNTSVSNMSVSPTPSSNPSVSDSPKGKMSRREQRQLIESAV